MSQVAELEYFIGDRLPLDGLNLYFDLLLEENKRVNLVSRETSRTDLLRITAESIVPMQWLNGATDRYLDIGAGGGFPSIPLLLAGVGKELTLLIDRTVKKVDALNRIIRKLNLLASVTQADFPITAIEGPFDLITLRFVKLTPRLLKSVLNLLNPAGSFVYYGQPEFETSGTKYSTRAVEVLQGEPSKQVTIFQKP